MAEIETAFPSTERPLPAGRERESTHSPSNEKATPLPPSHKRQHIGNTLSAEINESSDLYDPNMYGGSLRLNLAPH